MITTNGVGPHGRAAAGAVPARGRRRVRRARRRPARTLLRRIPGLAHGAGDPGGVRRACRRDAAGSKRNTQPYGLLHGGASAVLAETLGSIGLDAARRQLEDSRRRRPELHPPPRRPLRPGHRRGHTLHRGRSTATYEIVISDEEGRRVCSARLTCLLRDPEPGRRDPGARRDLTTHGPSVRRPIRTGPNPVFRTPVHSPTVFP
ncbi:hotdog fold thioesterase [Streptomyces sp. L7]